MKHRLKYTWEVEATGDVITERNRFSGSMIPLLTTKGVLYGRGSMFALWSPRRRASPYKPDVGPGWVRIFSLS